MVEIQEVDFSCELDEVKVSDWIRSVVEQENRKLGEITIVFGSDEWLLEKNREFLNHDYYTDIITFDYCEDSIISGDLLISVERVFENADDLNVSRETELNRVIVHGVLHLMGYSDKSDPEKELMRKKEDSYLALL
ncbi:MAG: rRNA maturation RNase YbeY [Brumimicrobium sp.]|nr:rRNA maturation RNase YbeY [Brumimicrobium sp.]